MKSTRVYHVTLGIPSARAPQDGRGDLFNLVLWVLTIAAGVAIAFVVRRVLGV